MQDYSTGFRISRSDLLLIWNFWHSNSFSLDHILRHGHCIVFQTVSEFIEYRFWFQVSVLVPFPVDRQPQWQISTAILAIKTYAGKVWRTSDVCSSAQVSDVQESELDIFVSLECMMPWLRIILKIDINNMSAVRSRRCHSCTPPSQQRYLLTPSLIQFIFSASA